MTTDGKRSNSLKVTALYLAPVVTFVALAVMLNVTDPLVSGPLSILIVFVLLYALVFSTLSVLFHVVSLIIRLLNPAKVLPLRVGYYVLSVASLAPVLLIAFNTLGQLDILECSLIFMLVALGCFYIVRRTAK